MSILYKVLCRIGFVLWILFLPKASWFSSSGLESNSIAPLVAPLVKRSPAAFRADRFVPKRNTSCDNIYQLVCQQPGITHDPTGYVQPDIAGEREAAHLYESIIQAHRDWTSEQVDEAVVKKIYSPTRRAKVLSAFSWVKNALEQIITQQPEIILTSVEKFQILFRLHKTRLQLPPPAKVYADESDIFLRNEVYYERTSDGELRLRVGGGYLLVAKSWFNLVFTLAHELGHAIDPCEIRSIRLALPAYDHLTACFMSHRLIALSKARSECGHNDQLSETFADWLAVQVTVKALEYYSTEFDRSQILSAAKNSVRDLCEQDAASTEVDTEFHPTPQVRIERIFGHNPKIRRILGCGKAPSRFSYCGFQADLPPLKEKSSYDSTSF